MRSHLVDVDPDAGIGYFVAESREEALIYGLPCRPRDRRGRVAGREQVRRLSGRLDAPITRAPSSATATRPATSSSTSATPSRASADDLGHADRGPRRGRGAPAARHSSRRSSPPAVAASSSGDEPLRRRLRPRLHRPRQPGEVEPVTLEGVVHEGVGELEGFDRIDGDRLVARFNIDGASWAYEGDFDEDARKITLGRVLCGTGELEGGVRARALPRSRRASASSSPSAPRTSRRSSTSLDGGQRRTARTRERPLGIDTELLSAGEDASFVSHDGLRVSARLYLPSPAPRLRRPAPARLLRARRPAGPGAAELRVVLDAAHPDARRSRASPSSSPTRAARPATAWTT